MSSCDHSMRCNARMVQLSICSNLLYPCTLQYTTLSCPSQRPPSKFIQSATSALAGTVQRDSLQKHRLLMQQWKEKVFPSFVLVIWKAQTMTEADLVADAGEGVSEQHAPPNTRSMPSSPHGTPRAAHRQASFTHLPSQVPSTVAAAAAALGVNASFSTGSAFTAPSKVQI